MSTVIGQIAGGHHFSVALSRTRGGRLLDTKRADGYLTEKQLGSLRGVDN